MVELIYAMDATSTSNISHIGSLGMASPPISPPWPLAGGDITFYTYQQEFDMRIL